MAFTPLNALHAFLAVARLRGFAAAAAELAVSPSALSQSVRQLEQRLGVALLTRTTRSVALTDAGRRLYETAAPAVGQALEALRVSAAAPGEITGNLRLTVPTLAVPFVVTPVLPRLLARHPRVTIEVTVEDRLVDIVAGGYDAGVRFSDSIERDMVQVRVSGPNRFVVVGAPEYLERRGVPQTPKDLLAHDCLCYRSQTTGGIYAWELERGKKSWRVPVRGPVIANEGAALQPLCRAGVGLMYAFEPDVAESLATGALRVVLEPYAAAVPGLFLYFPARAQASPTLRAFVEVARERLVAATPRRKRRRGPTA